MHHFDGAAGETESHGPEGGLTGPVGDDVERGAVFLDSCVRIVWFFCFFVLFFCFVFLFCDRFKRTAHIA